MSRRLILGKRSNSEDFLTTTGTVKRLRGDTDAQVVPDFEECSSETTQKVVAHVSSIPKVKYGTAVERHLARRAGAYVLGHEIGHNPAVPVNQFLARKDGTDQYFVLKVWRNCFTRLHN
jgi:hypothetical protein